MQYLCKFSCIQVIWPQFGQNIGLQQDMLCMYLSIIHCSGISLNWFEKQQTWPVRQHDTPFKLCSGGLSLS